jgi:thiol-disulfide isomerase/thioredoxin
MIKIITILIVTVLVIGGGVYYFTNKDSSTNDQQSMVQENDTAVPAETSDDINAEPVTSVGQFISYEDYLGNESMYADKQVVLFFSAKWCPTCQALNKDINTNLSDIPSDVVIVSVDYDSNLDLRRQYGVTVQHTLVLIDKEGNQIKKWTGGNTLDSVVSQI